MTSHRRFARHVALPQAGCGWTSRPSTGRLLTTALDSYGARGRLRTSVSRSTCGEKQVHGDAARLTQVVCNLLDNASKYTPEGGEVRFSVVAASDVLVMTVSDTGIGITAAGLPHIFEVFVQDTLAIGSNTIGLGIGLTVVHDLVQAHGGTVTAAAKAPAQPVRRDLPLLSDRPEDGGRTPAGPRAASSH